MKVVTAEEMQRIDKNTIEQLGIPGEVLMAYAGKSVADIVTAIIKPKSRVAVFCGTGNNGGDGFVIAYWLLNKGHQIDIYIAGASEKISNTSRVYYDVCRKMNINIIHNDKIDGINLNKYDLLVDAMLGTGFSGKPRGLIKDYIQKLNNSGIPKLSADLPSGLPSNGEAPEGDVIKADHTVTIGLPKLSLVTYPGKIYTGKLYIADIGFPQNLINSEELRIDLVDKDYVNSGFTFKRDPDFHKGNAGHILFIGGFDNMEGAIMMSVMAAMETGFGLATLLTTGTSKDRIAGKIPELMTRSLPSLNNNMDIADSINPDQKEKIKNEFVDFLNDERHYDAAVLGPGMGRTELSWLLFSEFIASLNNKTIKRILIDGDGLFHLARYIKHGKLPEETDYIITPHFGEASGLIGRSIDEIKNNRLKSAEELAVTTSAITLLKGPSTVISDGNNSLINTTGSAALATGGSGDVLSGIIGALLLRDINPLNAAGFGAYLHGLAGDIYMNENKTDTLKATDIISCIRKAIYEVKNL